MPKINLPENYSRQHKIEPSETQIDPSLTPHTIHQLHRKPSSLNLSSLAAEPSNNPEFFATMVATSVRSDQ
jgi:hypothetical protein